MLPLGVLGPYGNPPSGLIDATPDDISGFQLFEFNNADPQVLWWKFTAPAAGVYVFDAGLSMAGDGTPGYIASPLVQGVDFADWGSATSVLGDVLGVWVDLPAGGTVYVGLYGGTELVETEETTELVGPALLALRITGREGVTQVAGTEPEVLSYGTIYEDGTIVLPDTLAQPDPRDEGDLLSYRWLLATAVAESPLNVEILTEGFVLDPEGGPFGDGYDWRVKSDVTPAPGGRYTHSLVAIQRIPLEGLPLPEETATAPEVTFTFPEGIGEATVITIYARYNVFASTVFGTTQGGSWSNALFKEGPPRVGPSPLVGGEYFEDPEDPDDSGASGGIAVFANWPDDLYAFDPLSPDVEPNLDYPDGALFNPEGWTRLLPTDPIEASLAEVDLGRAWVFQGSQMWLQPRPSGVTLIGIGLMEIGAPGSPLYTFVPFGTESEIGGEFDVSRARFTRSH